MKKFVPFRKNFLKFSRRANGTSNTESQNLHPSEEGTKDSNGSTKSRVSFPVKIFRGLKRVRNFFYINPEQLSYNPDRLKRLRLLYAQGKYQEVKDEISKVIIAKRDPHITHLNKLSIQKLKMQQNSFQNNTKLSVFWYIAIAIGIGYFTIPFLKNYFYTEEKDNSKEKEKEKEEEEKQSTDSLDENDTISKMLGLSNSMQLKFASNVQERLDNVKGIDEVKEEIEQLIRMIKNPEKYVEAGAKLHKGILLCGKPGTGKTLIARAIAGESGVNFAFLTGSDFDEVFVGVGAARIKKMFETARKKKPCIIFIDEIDSLLTSSRRMSFEHSSSRATINQFLAEMDGFQKMEQVFIIGATNHEKDLDSAAVRPGRFDKKIHINIPDEDGRKEIIDHYVDKIKIKHDALDSKFISRMTPGFTGAEIENLVNMAIISAVNSKTEEVTMEEVGEARDRILMGISRKKFNASDRRRYLTSLHEGGHTLVCYRNPICKKKLHKLTIIPRGPAEGVTFTLYDEDALNSKEEFISEIDMAMGGHVAEELMYGQEMMTAGCSSDLNKATRVAQMMVKKLGMYGDKAGYIYIEDKNQYFYDKEKISENYKQSIDEAVKTILKESHDRVFDLLKRDANDLKNLAQAVFKFDTLNSKFKLLFNMYSFS